MHAYRTHNCAALTKAEVGETVRLSGWVHNKRDHGGVLFVELKTDTGRLSHDQQHWLDELHDGGSECHVWRPRKLSMIQKRLTEIAHPRHIDVTPSR